MDISIIIVNYNVKHFVLNCLKTIYNDNNSKLNFETIVIDNNSTDSSIAAIKEFFPQVQLIENKHNAGFPAANNQGFKIAKGNYIFMLNPDTELQDDALFKLFDFMENNSSIDIIAPMLLNSDFSFQSNVWRYPTFWSIFCEMHYLNFFLGSKNYKDKDFSLSFEAESFSGAAIFFRQEVLTKIGLLDETMFWIEDVDFCYRANQASLKLLYYPKSKIVHHIGQSAKKTIKFHYQIRYLIRLSFSKNTKAIQNIT
jgi:GT2 family glycosyltransferase